MNNKIVNLALFVAGAAIGSFVTWNFVKTKYETIANEEIKSVKESFAKRERTDLRDLTEKLDEVKQNLESTHVPEKPPIRDYAKVLSEHHYIEEENENMSQKEEPYVIEPGEFGEMDGYETISLTYYADGVVEDEYEDILTEDEIEDSVGMDALTRFGEYEDDSVFVRNDITRIDYEILKDNEKYYTLHPSNIIPDLERD